MPKPPSVQFSPERLKQIRLQRQFSVAALARLSGVSTAQIYRLERDKRPNVSAVTLARIALALNTSMEALMNFDTEQVQDPIKT